MKTNLAMFTAVFPTEVAIIKLEVVQYFCEPTKYYHYYQLVYGLYDFIASTVHTGQTLLQNLVTVPRHFTANEL